MKCTIPEIAWHNRDPVYSVDVQPGVITSSEDAEVYRLASGGTDCHVLIWTVKVKKCGSVTVDFASDLHRHQRAVNAVRFSPKGGLLASGDDESMVILWRQKEDNDVAELCWEEDAEGTEQWRVLKVLRGHVEDVYDLSWSPDARYLISGSVDNTAIVWDVTKGQNDGILKDHKGFVQGVAWDPQNKYVATLSSDRVCRLFSIKSRKTVHRISKSRPPGLAEVSPDENEKVVRLFHDDTFKSFFRRLCFTPCGELLITPSGLMEAPSQSSCSGTSPEKTNNKGKNATFIFSRYALNRPAVYLPAGDNYSIAVRCCPVLFKLRSECPMPPISQEPQDGEIQLGNTLFALPYRVIFAVATKNSVLLYDTQQLPPLGCVSNIHYTRLSDLTWSSDGKMLVVSSTDGYCSIVTFSEGELGVPYEPPASIAEPVATTLPKKESVCPTVSVPQEQVPMEVAADDEEDLKLFLEESIMDVPIASNTEKKDVKKMEEVKDLMCSPDKMVSPPKAETSKNICTPVKGTPERLVAEELTPSKELKKTPKRVPLITLSSPKSKKKLL